MLTKHQSPLRTKPTGMAKHSGGLLLLMILSSFMSISTLLAAEADDGATLLAFKAAAIGGAGNGAALASWNGSTSGYCNWEGVRCRGRHRRVVALSLPSHRLTGILSPAVGNLSSLRFLNLSSNGFSGSIPASLGRLHRLHTLDLSDNAFSGEIPVNLSSCTSLMVMDISLNQLHGHVPSEIGNKLTSLSILSLRRNNLTGAIPVSLANLSSLTILDLPLNQLEGTIPPGFGNIVGLYYLCLAFNNLSGEPPVSLYNLSSLKMLQIQENMLRGSIPTDIGTRFPRMVILCFGINDFTGSIPTSLSNLTELEVLDLHDNWLTGYVPHMLGRLQDLQRADLGTNMLEADNREGWEFITAMSNCSQLQQLFINDNDAFTGKMPISIVNLSTTMQILNVQDTRISGSIPSAIGNLVNLNFLNASNTFISGVIPDSIGKLVHLGELCLHNTNLSGQIPSSIGNISMLTFLDAHRCNLEGPIPSSIGKLKNLLALDLSMNRLNGSIPKDIFNLPVLSSNLDLSYNSLSGPLPSEVGSLGNLNNLFLSGNQLSGVIPDGIGDCTILQRLWLDNNSFEGSIPQSLSNLKGLNELKLSMNNLSGKIPDAIGSIRNLQRLYLAHNNLSGPIPSALQNLTSLSVLDLSFNNLQGEVPKGGIFTNFVNMSVTGNNKLCGGIPQLHLAPCQTNSVKKNRRGHMKSLTLALAVTSALLLLAFVVVLTHLFRKKLQQKQKSPFQPQRVDDQFARISYHALANGTNGFSEANLLGKGSFGSVYKCTLEGDGTITAVKVFNLEQSGSTRSFMAECEALRRVRHRCLLKIITCCSSVNHEDQEFKALIFEFMPNGNLNVWLHPQSDLRTLNNTLSLAQRLNIAVNIMDALDYLHNRCQPPIIHCDLKPSNILLAEDMSARVGDFGISRILLESDSKSLQNSSSTIGIRGSIGYVAPEYGEGSSVSTLGDVYSLGILLLEMFTGRSPTDDMFRGSLDLHTFAEDALPERIWELVDPTMSMHIDIYNSTSRSRIQNCLFSVVALGISCSKKQPRERIPIRDAMIEMHAIRDAYVKAAQSQGG